MPHLRSYFLTAQKIIEQYNGKMPLSAFLKNYFSKEKKYGSRDRKMIASLCYNYFRLGVSLATKTTEERLMSGLFLFSDTPNTFLQEKAKQWNENIALPVDEKVEIAGLDVENISPFNKELSDEINVVAFNRSFLTQPDLFIRIRPTSAASQESHIDHVHDRQSRIASRETRSDGGADESSGDQSR